MSREAWEFGLGIGPSAGSNWGLWSSGLSGRAPCPGVTGYAKRVSQLETGWGQVGGPPLWRLAGTGSFGVRISWEQRKNWRLP